MLAALDYAYQRWQLERSLRMTKQEVKDEMKEAEGNPEIKARIRQRQREISRRRMLAERTDPLPWLLDTVRALVGPGAGHERPA